MPNIETQPRYENVESTSDNTSSSRQAFSSEFASSCPGGFCPTNRGSDSTISDNGFPNTQICGSGGEVLTPEPNKWGDGDGYSNSINNNQGLDFRVGVEGSDGADGADAQPGDRSAPSSPDVEDSGDSQADDSTGEATSEKSTEERYQDALKEAAERGVPVVVVFGSKQAMDTQKLTEQTLQQNYKNDNAVFMFADTDNLDPNSDLGKVARRSEEEGKGLGPDGKPSGPDMVFTGIYTVEQKADGSLGLGRSTATFWGGRESITSEMQEQMQYAQKATLKLSPDNKPDDTTDNSPQVPDTEDDGRDDTDNEIDERPDNRPDDGNDSDRDDRPDDRDDEEDDGNPEDDTREREDEQRRLEEEARKREEAEKERLEEIARKKFDGSEHDAALEIAAKTGREVVMKFGAPWCGPCYQMDRNTFSNSNVQNFMQENNVFVNVNGDNHQDLVNRYGVSSYPTTLIGTVSEVNGRYQFNPRQRLSGATGPDRFLQELNR